MTSNIDDNTVDLICRYYKYYWQFKQNKFRILGVDEMKASSLMHDDQKNKYFFNLAKLISRYGIDVKDYMKFIFDDNHAGFNFKLGFSKPDNLRKLYGSELLKQYATHLQKQEKYRTILQSYLKSCKNIAKDCIEYGYMSSSSYIKYLIDNNMLAQMLLSGHISRHFISSFSRIKYLTRNMDSINRDTLKPILDVSEMLLGDLQDASVQLIGKNVDTITRIDTIIRNSKPKTV